MLLFAEMLLHKLPDNIIFDFIGLKTSTVALLPLLTVVFGMINGCCVVTLTALQVNTAPTTVLIHVTLRSLLQMCNTSSLYTTQPGEQLLIHLLTQ